MKAQRIALAIPAAFLLAAIVVRAVIGRAAAHAAPALIVALVQPLTVVTDWNALGAALLTVLFAATGVAALAYWHVIVQAPGRGPIVNSPWAIAGIAGFALVCAWSVPVLFSSDVFAYAAYGELARLGADPYAHAALPAGTALFDAVAVQWGSSPPACVYGPVFVWISAAVVGASASLGTIAQLDGLRLLASAALLLCALLAYAAYPGPREARLRAAATIGLNPAALWCAAEGHNDALAVAVALGGFALVRRGWLNAGTAVAALAGSMKLPGIAAALPLALLRRAWGGGAIGTAATLAISIPLLRSLATQLAPHGRYAPQASFQAVVAPFARSIWPALWAPATWAVAAAAAALATALGIRLLRHGQAEGWAYAALAGWLLIPNPYPWYGLWLLPVAAAAPGTRAAGALIGLSFASLLRYVPDAVGTPGTLASLALGIAASLPYLGLLARRRSGIINGSA